MNAIILAAGRGSRLGSRTAEKPKCLCPLAGKTLLEWQMTALRVAGVEPIGIVTGYRADALSGAADHRFHNPRWDETNMVGSLLAASSWLETRTCIVSYGDIVYHPDVVRALVAARGKIVISYDGLWESLWRLRFTDPLEDAETFVLDSGGNVVTIGKPTRSPREIQGQYMGLLRIEPEGWREIAAFTASMDPTTRDRIDMTSLLDRLAANGSTVSTARVEGRWCEVDSERDLAAYERALLAPDGWSHDWRSPELVTGGRGAP